MYIYTIYCIQLRLYGEDFAPTFLCIFRVPKEYYCGAGENEKNQGVLGGLKIREGGYRLKNGARLRENDVTHNSVNENSFP